MTLASGAGPPCPVNKQILRWSCFHFGLHLVHVEWRRLQVRVLPALSTNRYYDGAVFTLVFTLSMSNDAGFRCGSSLPCQQTDITMELFSLWSSPCPCRMASASGAGPPCPVNNRYYDGAVFTLVFTLSMSNDAGFRCGSSLPCQQTDITMENWADHSLHLVHVAQQILRWSCFHFGLHLVHVEWRWLQVRVLPALSTTDITMENWADHGLHLVHVAQQILRWSCFHFGLQLVPVKRHQHRALPTPHACSTADWLYQQC